MSRTKNGFCPTETYEEYLIMFHSACKELGRTITKTELARHDFDLPTDRWFVNNCFVPNKKTYNDFLISLGYEPFKENSPHRKFTYEIAFEEFAKRGFYLPLQEYTSCAIPLKYICPEHPNIIQEKSLNSLLFGEVKGYNGCRYCYLDKNCGSGALAWKGGSSPLNTYLRDFITEWKKFSMRECNYKCVITGDDFKDIHHLYSFNKIIKEILDECKLPIYNTINNYTEDELNLFKLTCVSIHSKYPLGVCLRKDIHNLYHSIYGDDNTPEQFEEFKNRYNNGEFIEVLKSKTKDFKNTRRVKFNEVQVAEIREKYSSGKYILERLATEYNTNITTIFAVVNFRGGYKIT